MAKSSNRGGGEGTYDKGGVRCTVDAPFTGGASKGSQGTLAAPFNAPRTGGDNGLPTTIYSSMGGPKGGGAGTLKPNSRDSLDTIKTNPKGPRR